MVRVEREEPPAILEDDARFGRQQSRTEGGEQALDPTHGVAPLVDSRDIDGVSRVAGIPLLGVRRDWPVDSRRYVFGGLRSDLEGALT